MAERNIHNLIHTLNLRYKDHCARGDGIFAGHRSQLEARAGIGHHFGQINPATKQPMFNSGYGVSPPRTGKTIVGGDYIVGINTMPDGTYVLGDPVLGKHALICVPTNQLVDQWADRLLGELQADGTRKPNLFGDRFKPENVAIYHADQNYTDAEKAALLAKPVVIITNGSVLSLSQPTLKRPALLKGEDFDVMLADEVDLGWRGDVHNGTLRDVFEGKCQIIGLTATHLYKTGKTVGDYIFNGQQPMFEITHQEAIDRKEIAPNHTITYEMEVDRVDSDIVVKSNSWDTLTDTEKEKFIQQTGSDNTALEIIKVGSHPKTGVPLRNLRQLWKGETIKHSELFAQRLNEVFGAGRPADEPYAAVVSGETPPKEVEEILRKYKAGKIRAIVQCKYIGRGFDDAGIELTAALAPSQSPNDLIQFYTRADTLNGDKMALHLAPRFVGSSRFPRINQLHIGELLGGQIMIPAGEEYGPTADKPSGASGEKEPWPVIEGVQVYYTLEHMEQLARKLRGERLVDGLPPKKANTLNVVEMARALHISPEILEARVYGPLRAAYDAHGEYEKTLPHGMQKDEFIYLSGTRFPLSGVGYCNDKGREEFCIDEKQCKYLTRFALYGGLKPVRPEMLNKDAARIRLKVPSAEIDRLWEGLQHTFFMPKAPYAQSANVNGIMFPYQDFSFSLRNGEPELFITPDALLPAHRFFTNAGEDAARSWMRSNAKALKTAEWLTAAEIAENLSLYGEKAKELAGLFVELNRKKRTMAPDGEEKSVPVGQGKDAYPLRVALKHLPSAAETGVEQKQICIHRSQLGWLKSWLNFETAYDPATPKAGQVRS